MRRAKGRNLHKAPWGNFSEIAQNFYLMIKLVCILGLGWISCNMGVLGAMFPAFFESDFESECDSESECESCSGDMKV